MNIPFSHQVHTFHRRCNGKAACICSIAVRSGDDVIVFKACPNKRGDPANRPLEVIVYTHGELTPGTRILSLQGGRSYEVSSK